VSAFLMTPTSLANLGSQSRISESADASKEPSGEKTTVYPTFRESRS